MRKAYSEDLRKSVIHCYEQGMSKKIIIELFKIGKDTLNHWIRQYKATGNLTPKKRTHYRAKQFSDEALCAYIKHHPSPTLKDIAEHFSVQIASVHSRLKHCAITRKKTFLCEERDEQAKANFIKHLNTLESHSVVYIDESGIKNNIKNLYDRALRSTPVKEDQKGLATEKLNSIAALLHHKLIASCLLIRLI